MELSSILLVLLSAAIHVGWNTLVKSSRDPRAFSAAKGVPLVALGLASLPVLPLAAIPAEVWWWIGASGTIHAFYVLALSNAYTRADISLVYPITRSAPAFVPIAAFLWIGETVSLRGGLGIAIVVACIVALHAAGTDRRLGSILSSARARESRWAFFTLGSVVVYTLVDKSAMLAFRTVDAVAPEVQALVYLILLTTICYALYWAHEAVRGASGFRQVARDEWRRALLAGAGTFASYSLILYVFQTEKVSYVVALRQSSILLAVGVGWLWLGEERGRSRALVACAMVLGLVLVATAE